MQQKINVYKELDKLREQIGNSHGYQPLIMAIHQDINNDNSKKWYIHYKDPEPLVYDELKDFFNDYADDYFIRIGKYGFSKVEVIDNSHLAKYMYEDID